MKFFFEIFGFLKKFFSVFNNFLWKSCVKDSLFSPYFFKKFHVFSEFNGIFNLLFFNQRIRINYFKKRNDLFPPCPPAIKRSPYSRFSVFDGSCRTTKMFFEKINWSWICHVNAYIKSVTKILIATFGDSPGNSNTTFTIKKTGGIGGNFFGYQQIYE